MSVDKEKKFVYKHVFENMRKYCCDESLVGPKEKHFGVSWQIDLYKDIYDGIIAYFNCECLQTGDWSINTTCDLFVNGKPFSHEIRNDSATIEVRVKIDKMTGSFRNFDDDVAKEASDVALKIGDHKFYVYKNYLSFHSTYFKSLFSGNFEESGKSEIELRDIDPKEFHTFLGIIYGFLLVEESNVSKMLKLADFFDAQIVMERCEQFLMTVSTNDFVEKFKLSLKYKFDDLKNKCLSEMNKNTNFDRLALGNCEEYNAEIWRELFLKAVDSLK